LSGHTTDIRALVGQARLYELLNDQHFNLLKHGYTSYIVAETTHITFNFWDLLKIALTYSLSAVSFSFFLSSP